MICHIDVSTRPFCCEAYQVCCAVNGVLISVMISDTFFKSDSMCNLICIDLYKFQSDATIIRITFVGREFTCFYILFFISIVF